ncbi:hypothetical protein FHY73_23975 [Bacillus tropicus]|uniref:hypothetical protein n=1 Tax=Bacillus tropicus TaxID=2026188 RepID=UPI001123D0AA|nr:hypothetical protein [Bacillus tropicus]TNP14081.1 hypothetical protein FHY73_23975 [Bacillus tropicus]
MGLEFFRSIRTSNGEQYLISDEEGFLGELSLHIQNSVHGIFVFVKDMEEGYLDFILQEVEERIVSMIEPREDFIFTVYKGEEVGFYSDTGNSFNLPVTQTDLKKITESVEGVSKSLSRVLNKHSVASGQLNQFAVVDYFKAYKYDADIAPTELDHKKIDVIARMDSDILFVQVKNGQISNTEIKKVVEYVVKDITVEQGQNKKVGIVADKFHHNSEMYRMELEKAYGIAIMFIHKYHVLSLKPEYKRVLD